MNKFLIFLILCLPQIVFGQEYTVAVKQIEPFAFKTEQGTWAGLNIQLLDQLSKINNFHYNIVEVNTVEELLTSTIDKKTDFSIGAISITSERERNIDFSHSYFNTSPGILIKEKSSTIEIFKKVGMAFFLFILVLYLLGYIISKLDSTTIKNINDGAWFSLVTTTTTGYGDIVPKNNKSKIFTALMMISSMFLMSVFTGYVSSTWTVSQLTNEPTTIQDLIKTKKVITISGSTSEQLLNSFSIKHSTVNSVNEGIDNVVQNKANAFVYDSAILDYLIKNNDNNLQVWPIKENVEQYAIVFPNNSMNLEKFNISLLNVINSSYWKTLINFYFNK